MKTRKPLPKLRFTGLIIVLIGCGVALIDLNVLRTGIGVWGIPIVMFGMVFVVFSLKKSTRKKIANVLDPCQCCKCTNCGRNHNHWTHD